MRFGWYALLLLAVLTLGIRGVEAGCYTPKVWKKVRVEPRSTMSLSALKFKGGERACVIVMGDQKPVQRITVEVYDSQALKSRDQEAQPVARADSQVAPGADTDLVSVIWYPPRDAEYVVLVSINGKIYDECYISVK